MTRETPGEAQAARSPTAPDGVRPLQSLLFWCCLALSAAIFAAVFLAPRLRTYRGLAREYAVLEGELVASERQVDYLQKVADALSHDRAFAAELARVDFGPSGPEERIAVRPALSFNGDLSAERNVTRDTANSVWPHLLDMPLLESLSDDQSMRASLLGAASFLVLIAFTCCCGSPRANDSDEEAAGARWPARCRQWFVARYSRTKTRSAR